MLWPTLTDTTSNIAYMSVPSDGAVSWLVLVRGNPCVVTNSDGYNINTFLIIVNIVNQVTTISDMLQRESSNQVVTQIWECVSTMVRIGYPDILLEIWVSKEAQWVVRNLVKNMHSWTWTPEPLIYNNIFNDILNTSTPDPGPGRCESGQEKQLNASKLEFLIGGIRVVGNNTILAIGTKRT